MRTQGVIGVDPNLSDAQTLSLFTWAHGDAARAMESWITDRRRAAEQRGSRKPIDPLAIVRPISDSTPLMLDVDDQQYLYNRLKTWPDLASEALVDLEDAPKPRLGELIVEQTRRGPVVVERLTLRTELSLRQIAQGIDRVGFVQISDGVWVKPGTLTRVSAGTATSIRSNGPKTILRDERMALPIASDLRTIPEVTWPVVDKMTNKIAWKTAPAGQEIALMLVDARLASRTDAQDIVSAFQNHPSTVAKMAVVRVVERQLARQERDALLNPQLALEAGSPSEQKGREGGGFGLGIGL